MSTGGYQALLLDFGGVCLRYPVELHAHTERALGLVPGTLTWFGPLDPSTDDLWRELLAGRLTEREYWERRVVDLGALAGRSLSVRDYMAILFACPEDDLIRPEAVAALTEIRAAGIRTGILTNDLEAFAGPAWKQSISFFRLIDSYTDVSHSGALKPDPRAYAQGLADLGVDRKQVLFVDDQPANVEGARRVGLEAIAFDVVAPRASWRTVLDRALGDRRRRAGP